MKMKNNLNNTVIKVLDREHGKKVIEWWQSQGIKATPWEGSMNEKDGYTAIYYGVIKGDFGNVNYDFVKSRNLKVIELPSVEQPKFFAISPEDWQEYQELKRERNKVDVSRLKTGSVVMLKYTNNYCRGRENVDFNEPFYLVIKESECYIYDKHEIAKFEKSNMTDGRTFNTFMQDGNYIHFTTFQTDYITEVISY